MKISKSILTSVLALLVASCAGGPARDSAPRDDHDPYFRSATVADRRPATAEKAEWPATDFVVKVIVRSFDGAFITDPAPTVALVEDRPAGILIGKEISFIESAEMLSIPDAAIAEPEVGVLREGLTVDLAARAVPDSPRVRLAFRVARADLRRPMPLRTVEHRTWEAAAVFQIPRIDLRVAKGVHEVSLGRLSRLARLPAPRGEGWIDILVRVVAAPSTGEPLAPGGAVLDDPTAPERLLRMLDAAKGDGGRLALEAVILRSDLPAGVPLVGGAVDAYRGDVARTLRRFDLASSLTPGAAIRGILKERYVKDYERATPGEEAEAGKNAAEPPQIWRPVLADLVTGLDAAYDERGELGLRWSFSPRWEIFTTRLENGTRVPVDRPEAAVHEWRGSLPEGRSLVPLARLVGGGTAAVFVTIETGASAGGGPR